MDRSQNYIGMPNGIVLCVDARQKRQMKGRFFHGYSRGGVSFSNCDQMLFRMEKFLDWLNFPHPTSADRTFKETEPGGSRDGKRVKVMSDEELLKQHGDLGTFILRVQHRQNNSWQGRITWAEQDKTLCFRSIWEMMKLIESAIESVDGVEKNSVSWFD